MAGTPMPRPHSLIWCLFVFVCAGTMTVLADTPTPREHTRTLSPCTHHVRSHAQGPARAPRPPPAKAWMSLQDVVDDLADRHTRISQRVGSPLAAVGAGYSLGFQGGSVRCRNAGADLTGGGGRWVGGAERGLGEGTRVLCPARSVCTCVGGGIGMAVPEASPCLRPPPPSPLALTPSLTLLQDTELLLAPLLCPAGL